MLTIVAERPACNRKYRHCNFFFFFFNVKASGSSQIKEVELKTIDFHLHKFTKGILSKYMFINVNELTMRLSPDFHEKGLAFNVRTTESLALQCI